MIQIIGGYLYLFSVPCHLLLNLSWCAYEQTRGGELDHDNDAVLIGHPFADPEAPASAKQPFLASPDDSITQADISSSNTGNSNTGNSNTGNSNTGNSNSSNFSVRYPSGQKVSVTFAEFFFVSIFLMATFMLRLESFTPPMVNALDPDYGKARSPQKED